jgi:hypothetical protein
MGIEEGDKKPNAKLASIAQAIEDFVDSFTNRKLEAQVYRTNPEFCYLDGNGKRWMYLPQYPISYITEVNIDSEREFGSGTVVASADIFWYPSGKVVTEGDHFQYGRRNIRFDYVAGYAPVVGGTHNAVVSSYPIPNDLKQVMTEMIVMLFKQGITEVHTSQSSGGEGVYPKFYYSMVKDSFWLNTLNKYKAFDVSLSGNEE